MLVNMIGAMILLLLVGSALFYIRKEKKKGVRCIGCPNAGKCSCGCGGHVENTSQL
ncbi:MAG: FeoB-associated Cys-rich membrane protein [Dorea sp.]|nr:FeoB-associated Cys-rich membrane protein [Dorea sp.]